MGNKACTVCAWERATGKTVDTSKAKTAWASEVGSSEAAIRRHLKHPSRAVSAIKFDEMALTYVDDKHDPENGSSYTRMAATAWGEDDWRDFLRAKGTDPDEVTFNFGVTSNPSGGYWNKLNNVRPKTLRDQGAPAWPVVQQATPVSIKFETPPPAPARNGLSLSLKCADPQIGYRAVGTGYEEFHDLRAMNLFTKIVHAEQPESVMLLGDIIDLPSQSRWAQEAGFARTTQMAIDMTHEWLAALRAAAPSARIVVIEGNHDKRLQAHMETNALASFGLKRANRPAGWPVMSIPYLLRLEELDIEYMDAYPTAVAWDDDRTRNIHGTRANSKGSTTSQYMQDLPHISTWVGHTHRCEITYKTVMGPRGEAIESYTANPGALCKTDGTVPSVHGAIHADGTSAKVVEDWQQGFGSLLYGEGQAWPQVHRIKDGVSVYNGKRYVA